MADSFELSGNWLKKNTCFLAERENEQRKKNEW